MAHLSQSGVAALGFVGSAQPAKMEGGPLPVIPRQSRAVR